MEVLKVSAKSSPNSVAGALAGVLREKGGAEIQAAGICQHMQPFSDLIGMRTQLFQAVDVPIQLAPGVKGVKAIRKIIDTLRCTDLHIHGGTDIQTFKILPYKPSDHRRGGGNRNQIPFAAQAVDQIADRLEKRPFQTSAPVAVRVQQQIQADSRIRDPAQILPLPLGRFPWEHIFLQTHDASAARHGIPGKIDLGDLILMGKNVIYKIIALTQLISYIELHEHTP